MKNEKTQTVQITKPQEGPDGTIAIITAETARYTRFWNCMLALQMPRVKIISKLGMDVAKMRNEAIAEMEGEWIFFIDDDHTFNPDILMKLLSYDVDMVQPLCLKKYAPFGPVHMGPQLPESEAHWQHALLPTDPHGLKEVHAVGAAMTLIRKRVIDAIPRPWYEIGKLEADGLGEDIYFSRKVRTAGFKIFCDLTQPVGHLNVGMVTAERTEDGSWRTVVEFGTQRLAFPTVAPQYKVQADGSYTLLDEIKTEASE